MVGSDRHVAQLIVPMVIFVYYWTRKASQLVQHFVGRLSVDPQSGLTTGMNFLLTLQRLVWWSAAWYNALPSGT